MRQEIQELRKLTRNNAQLRREIRDELYEEMQIEMAQELARKEKLMNISNKKKLEK